MPFLSTDIKIVDLETGIQELPRGEDGELEKRKFNYNNSQFLNS
jgi:hypothetical protein